MFNCAHGNNGRNNHVTIQTTLDMLEQLQGEPPGKGQETCGKSEDGNILEEQDETHVLFP